MIKTKRWNDPVEDDDGFRLLVTRYWPRPYRKEEVPHDAWDKDLGPSRILHADWTGKHGGKISWGEFEERYLDEMEGQRPKIESLASRVASGENITLLCSSRCEERSRCHTALLKAMIEEVSRAGSSRQAGTPRTAGRRS